MLGPGPLAFAACLATALWTPPARAQQIADLGSALPVAINSGGTAAGATTTMMEGCYGNQYPFTYSGGVVTPFSALGLGTFSSVNDGGDLVGNLFYVYGGGPFLYSGGAKTDLIPAGIGVASAINNGGQIVGWTTGSVEHAVVYSNGTLTDLGTLGGGFSVATAINAGGQVAGYSDMADGSQHAFLYSNGVMHDLGTLGGTNSHALAINASGQVAGDADLADGWTHAFLFSGGFMLDLGTLGGSDSYGFGINNFGQVVGYSEIQVGGGPANAFIYSNGVMTALNSLLPPGSQWGLINGEFGQAGLEQAFAVNDNGQIAGCAYINPSTHGFIYTLTPNLTGLSPATAAPGGPAFTLTVTGTDFLPGATVNWNLAFFSTALATTYVSATQLTAAVPASLIATPGTPTVTVTTTQGASPAAAFAIRPPRPSPGVPEPPRGGGKTEAQ